MASGIPPGIDLAASRRDEMVGAFVSTWIIATIAFFARFLSRRVAKAGYWWDDWLMIPAWIGATIQSHVAEPLSGRALGRHIYIVPPQAIPETVRDFFLVTFIVEVCYVVVIVFAKLSVLAFYWRLFSVKKQVRYATMAAVPIVFAWALGYFIIIVVQCRPLHGFWDRSVPAVCDIDNRKFFVGNSIPNIVTDFALLLIPLPAVWQLQLSLKQKVLLSGIFLVGIFATATSIVRLHFLTNLDTTNPDVTWEWIDTQIWTVVELNIAVTCGCLPQLGPLISWFKGPKKPRPTYIDSRPTRSTFKGQASAEYILDERREISFSRQGSNQADYGV